MLKVKFVTAYILQNSAKNTLTLVENKVTFVCEDTVIFPRSSFPFCIQQKLVILYLINSKLYPFQWFTEYILTLLFLLHNSV